MTARLHDGDRYRVEFPARVALLADDHVVLDQTYFFGPHKLVASDIGMIGGLSVNDLRRSSEETVEHVLADRLDRSDGGSIRSGDLVDCAIDWDHRYSIMKLHTAQHLVDLAARATHDVADVQLRPVTRSSAELVIDFADDAIDCPAVLQWLDTVIGDDLACAVSTAASAPFDRVWHLDGHGHYRCNALHVDSTGEIDCVTLSSSLLEPTRLAVTLRAETDSYSAELDESWVFISSRGRHGYCPGNGGREAF